MVLVEGRAAPRAAALCLLPRRRNWVAAAHMHFRPSNMAQPGHRDSHSKSKPREKATGAEIKTTSVHDRFWESAASYGSCRVLGKSSGIGGGRPLTRPLGCPWEHYPSPPPGSDRMGFALLVPPGGGGGGFTAA